MMSVLFGYRSHDSVIDNPASPSIVEQLSQGLSLVVIPLLVIIPRSLKYPMPYAWFLAPSNMGGHMFLLLFLNHAFPSVIAWDSLCVCIVLLFFLDQCSWGSVVPLYLGYSPIESWDSLSGYVHPGIACLASWASHWLGAFWASLSDYSSKHDELSIYTLVNHYL